MYIRRSLLLMILCGVLLVGTASWVVADQKSIDEISKELEVKAEELKKKVEAFFAFKPNIFRDIEWKTRIEDLEEMVVLSDTETDTFYKKRGETLTIEDLQLESKIYRFYNNQLLSITITARGEDNFEALKELAFREFDGDIQFDNSLPEWFWIDLIGGGVRLLRYEKSLEEATLYLLSTGLYQQKKKDLGRIVTPIEKRELSQAAKWSHVINWKGDGAKTTEPFVIQSKMWRIEWQNLGHILQVYLNRINGDFVSIPVNTSEKGKDVSYVYEKGEFYLTINAVGEWQIDIEEKVGEI